MRTDTRLTSPAGRRLAAIAGSATIAGAMLLGAAAPAFAGHAASESVNGSAVQPGGLDSCGSKTTLGPISVPGYASGDQTVTDPATGLSATFSKSAGNTNISWSTNSDVKVSAAFFLAGNSSDNDLLVTYSGVSSDQIVDIGTNQVSSMTICYSVTVSPTPTNGETPPPTSMAASTSQDNGAWKLALLGVGGILATLAVVAPRRFGKKR